MATTPPRVLTIAGSDSGGGAGIQADLKTFAAHAVYGMSVITAVTAQNTRGVSAVAELPSELVGAQIDAVFDDIGVDALKIGMLSSAGIIAVVAERLRHWSGPPVVLDPVMVAKSGDPLLAEDAVEALRAELVPLATVLTPNLPEASRLAGSGPTDSEEQRLLVARRLAESGPAVLLKGGHLEDDTIVDLLCVGREVHRWTHPRVASTSTHGTGCTLSAAIAARLARGDELVSAVGGAIEYLQGAIRAAYPVGEGCGPVNHLYRLEPRHG
ncbi:MAG: bifunctional hydroxymethylpyrimidine kinase/phosphomethylpyrimidine kinase [Thermoanaerobaculia bacterium]